MYLVEIFYLKVGYVYPRVLVFGSDLSFFWIAFKQRLRLLKTVCLFIVTFCALFIVFISAVVVCFV